MANDNNIQHFSAADIEKYHKGLLSRIEMHAMEKAALDDPFLADALEGYALTGVDIPNDLAELRKRLDDRTGKAKVIPMAAPKLNRYRWLRVAAMITIIAGAGLLANQLLFNKKADDIAFNDTPSLDKSIPLQKDSTIQDATISSVDEKTNSGTKKPADTKGPVSLEKSDNFSNLKIDERTSVPVSAIPVTDLPVTIKEEKAVAKTTAPAGEPEKKIAAQKEGDKRSEQDTKSNVANTGGNRDQRNSNTVFKDAETRRSDMQYRSNTNTFRGRVTDGSNYGVPFANVTNVADSVGTYTDASGYFNLTSPDSVLNVQVRSIGFENNVTQLRNSVPNNQVILQDDRSLSEVVINNKKPNAAARSRESNIKIEESEPADGWEKYDAYLANNLKTPEEFKSKQVSRASVEVSFEVDKNGEPTNFKIVKSLCESCDAEAIRLLKEGPKWKRKARKGRTTVTINF